MVIDRDKWYDSEIIQHLYLTIWNFGWDAWEVNLSQSFLIIHSFVLSLQKEFLKFRARLNDLRPNSWKAMRIRWIFTSDFSRLVQNLTTILVIRSNLPSSCWKQPTIRIESQTTVQNAVWTLNYFSTVSQICRLAWLYLSPYPCTQRLPKVNLSKPSVKHISP